MGTPGLIGSLDDDCIGVGVVIAMDGMVLFVSEIGRLVVSGCTAVVNDGTVSGCTAVVNDGTVSGCTAVVNDGTVSGCTAVVNDGTESPVDGRAVT